MLTAAILIIMQTTAVQRGQPYKTLIHHQGNITIILSGVTSTLYLHYSSSPLKAMALYFMAVITTLS